jgi:hypothetical protein
LAVVGGGLLVVAVARRRQPEPVVTVMRPVALVGRGDLLLESLDRAAPGPTDDTVVAAWVRRLDPEPRVMLPPRAVEILPGVEDPAEG